jgi:hypothetical protein
LETAKFGGPYARIKQERNNGFISLAMASCSRCCQKALDLFGAEGFLLVKAGYWCGYSG